MKITIRTLLWALIACLGLWQALVFAQSTDNKQNLLACKKGWEACDRSTLTQSGSAEVAVADHARAVSNCRNGLESCDHSKLTGPEGTALAVTDHERNVSNCKDGLASCDHSRLTHSEAGAMSLFRGSRCRVDHPGRHPRIHLLFEKAGTQAQHLGCTMRLSTEVLPVSRGARLHARECESHSIAKTGIETGTGCHRGSVPHATRGDSGLWASF